VRGRDHRPGRIAELADREVELVGAGQAQVNHVRALVRHPAHQPPGDFRAGNAHIPPDRDLIDAQESDECPPDLEGDLLIQLRWVDPAHIVRLKNRRIHFHLPSL